MFFSSRVEKMAVVDVLCSHCNSKEVIKNGGGVSNILLILFVQIQTD